MTDALTNRDELRERLAAEVGEDHADAALAAYEDAAIAGLCHEGAWEAAVGKETTAQSHKSTMDHGES